MPWIPAMGDVQGSFRYQLMRTYSWCDWSASPDGQWHCEVCHAKWTMYSTTLWVRDRLGIWEIAIHEGDEVRRSSMRGLEIQKCGRCHVEWAPVTLPSP